LRHVFEAVVRACMNAGLVKGEGFAVDASVIEANAMPPRSFSTARARSTRRSA
jgi:transposase